MKKRKLLAIFLALMMLSSTGAVLASCKDDDTTDSTTEEETENEEESVSDDYIVTNAGFETFDKKDGENLIATSVNGWSRSTNSTASGSAKSSSAASGIIDTATWDDLTTSGLGDLKARELTEEQAKANWDKMTARDKLEFYEAWEDNDDNDTDVDELDFYQTFNIDENDLPLYRTKDDDGNETAVAIANPGTHDNSTENTKVLMIHNEYSTSSYNKFGTAQKFTSSSTVTVSAGTSAKFSVWVKTSNLEMTGTDGKVQDAINRGAYIEITNTLGGTKLDPIVVENIAVSEWTQYEFVLKGSEYADATFTIVLGLGRSGGDDRHEYVNGYAFFDDIKCETLLSDNIDLSDYEQRRLSDDKESKTLSATEKKVALDLSGVDVTTSAYAFDVTLSDTREEATSSAGTDYYTSVTKQLGGADLPNGVKTWEGLGFNPENDKVQIYNNAAAMNESGNAYLQTAYDEYFKDVEFLKDEKVLMLLSASGASYTATQASATLNANSYAFVSFFVKTSNMSGFTGAGVSVKDGNGEIVSTLSSIDTSAIEGVKVGDNEDVYNGWQKCFIFLSNETDDTQDYTIEFTFGPTTISGTTKTSYQTGFAAFAGMEQGNLNEEQFAYAQSGTYALIANLDADGTEETGDSGFDSVSSGSTTKIEDGYADLKNFKGVTPDSAYLTNSTNFEINKVTTAGLLSKDALKDEDDANWVNDKYTTILQNLMRADNKDYNGLSNEQMWNSVFGNSKLADYSSNQPLVIYNETEQAYGFIGAKTSITDYTVVSYNVKVSAGATANFYLVDMDDDKNVMSIAGKTAYFYDKDGNICSVDPTSNDFNSKKDVAFKLQSNGLYKLNAGWKHASDVANKDAFYANLSAYDKDAAGNLLVADGGVSYDYNSKWRNDGNDGIAFYYNDGKYYADSAKTVEVLALDSVADLETRADAYANQNMQITVTGNGEWSTVTFYLHPGDNGKNYRLEVWSGSRDGATKSAAGSYVIVDARTPDALTAETFASYSKDRQTEIDDNKDLGAYFESVFSFYDSAKFLRYDESLDENEVGNSYNDFDPTSADYVKGIAYLYYEKGNTYEIYADYATVDRTVVADVDEVEDEEETEEETEEESELNVWLLISSISMSAILLLVILLIIFRKAFKLNDRKTRVKKVKVKKEKPAKKTKAVEEKDQDSPYND